MLVHPMVKACERSRIKRDILDQTPRSQGHPTPHSVGNRVLTMAKQSTINGIVAANRQSDLIRSDNGRSGPDEIPNQAVIGIASGPGGLAKSP